MTEFETNQSAGEANRTSVRDRAIDAYDSARARATDSFGEAPLIALAGGLAAGALIAALLPRTESETRLVRPTARRVKTSASAAVQAARETGVQQLSALGLSRDKAEETIQSLLRGITDAAKTSAQSALDAARDKR
jgi:hypothetical protein